MQMQIELRFDLEPVVPDTPQDLAASFNTAVEEAAQESGLGDTIVGKDVNYEQHLPLTPEQAEMLRVGVIFLLTQGPKLWDGTRDLVQRLMRRLSGGRGSSASCKIQVSDQTIELKNLTLDAMTDLLPHVMQALATSTNSKRGKP